MTGFAMARADPTDVMPRRIAAYVIDTAIALVVVVAIAVPIFSAGLDRVSTAGRSKFCDNYKDRHPNAFCVASNDTAYILSADEVSEASRAFYGGAFGWTLLNAVLLQGLTGGTVGKLLLGLRVVRGDGRRAGIGWCALRTIPLILVDALCFIIGLVVALSSKGHRRVGDMVASTFVVSKVYEGHPIVVPGLTGPPVPTPGYGAPPTAAPGPVSAEGPTWDPARDAYIQYDRARSAWLQWDDAAQQWKPIDAG